MKSCAHKVHITIWGRKDRRRSGHTGIRKDGTPKTMSLRFSYAYVKACDRVTQRRKLCPSAFLRKGGGQK